MTIAFLALGSNIDDRETYLQKALAKIAALPATEVTAVSSFWETDPVGGPPQGRFVNAVCAVETGLSPRALLEAAKSIESRLGRIERERWGPREIDIDIILYGDETVDEPDLVIPHPLAAEREFVTGPLAEIAPEMAEELERQCE